MQINDGSLDSTTAINFAIYLEDYFAFVGMLYLCSSSSCQVRTRTVCSNAAIRVEYNSRL